MEVPVGANLLEDLRLTEYDEDDASSLDPEQVAAQRDLDFMKRPNFVTAVQRSEVPDGQRACATVSNYCRNNAFAGTQRPESVRFLSAVALYRRRELIVQLHFDFQLGPDSELWWLSVVIQTLEPHT